MVRRGAVLRPIAALAGLLALLLLPGAAAAQTVGGFVTDTAGARVPGVLVEVVSAQDRVVGSATSDGDGTFRIPLRRGGTFSLRLSRLGYSSVTARLDEIRGGDEIEVEVLMVPGSITLEPIVVTSRSESALAGFYARMERPGFGQFVTRSEIEQRPATRASDLLQQVGGVVLMPVQTPGCRFCARQNLVMLRSALGSCSPTVYVDGAVIEQDASTPLDSFLTAEMLEGIEVYRGVSAPPPLHSRTQCGVVAFWTRRETTGPPSFRRVLTLGGIALGMITLTTLLMLH